MTHDRRLQMLEQRVAALEGGRDVDGAPAWARPYLNVAPPGERLYRDPSSPSTVIAYPWAVSLGDHGYTIFIGCAVQEEDQCKAFECYGVNAPESPRTITVTDEMLRLCVMIRATALPAEDRIGAAETLAEMVENRPVVVRAEEGKP